MFKKVVKFLENQGCKSKVEEDEKISALQKEKGDYTFDALKTLVCYATAISHGEKGSYQNRLKEQLEKLQNPKEKNDYKDEESPRSDNLDSWINEDGLIEIFKMILSPDYDPPSNNIILMQVHLWTFHLYYRFLVTMMKKVPLYEILQVDWSLVKIMKVIGMIYPMMEKFIKEEDSKFRRQDSQIKKAIDSKHINEAMELFSNLMKDEVYKDKKTGKPKPFSIAKEVEFRLRQKWKGVASADTIRRYAIKNKLIE